jgi:hypothetical protein
MQNEKQPSSYLERLKTGLDLQKYKEWEDSLVSILTAHLSGGEQLEDYLDLNDYSTQMNLLGYFKATMTPRYIADILLS